MLLDVLQLMPGGVQMKYTHAREGHISNTELTVTAVVYAVRALTPQYLH